MLIPFTKLKRKDKSVLHPQKKGKAELSIFIHANFSTLLRRLLIPTTAESDSFIVFAYVRRRILYLIRFPPETPLQIQYTYTSLQLHYVNVVKKVSLKEKVATSALTWGTR